MALPILPNPSNFLAVALVINRSRDGPRFVFHYPPHVLPVQDNHEGADEEDPEEDDLMLERAARPASLDAATGSPLNTAEFLKWNQDDHLATESGTQIVPWEYVAGFPTKDLEGILTPARAYHKRLFRVSLDPLYCVSYPIYVPENGVWKKKKKKDKKRQDQKEASDLAPDESPQEGRQTDAPLPAEGVHVEAKDTAGKPAANTAGRAAAEEAEDKVSSMTMFNLVFILNPKKHEAKELVDTMYSNIIRKVNKAYKYCQQRNDFVWKASKKILALKDKAREDKRKMSALWDDILQSSSLAASMQDLYEAISRNKIATLQFGTDEGLMTHSVQIPFPFHVADLPQDGEDDARGLWLTTANSFISEEAAEEPGYLDKNFALLLMDDDKKITAELQADPDETTYSMVEFVRHSKPTMSFHQVAQQSTNILSLAHVRRYAQHFIFWRRAIAIPPLHARDTYILSPNADLRRLPRASAEWARQFPFAPALPNFLADLSAAPRPYKWFCPSKSYRPAYLTMLAWLMCGGWVTQLCTFAYVVVWPEIIYEVEYALEAEEVARAKRAQAAALGERERERGRGSSSSSASSASLASAPRREAAEGASTMTSSTATLRPGDLSGDGSARRDSDLARRLYEDGGGGDDDDAEDAGRSPASQPSLSLSSFSTRSASLPSPFAAGSASPSSGPSTPQPSHHHHQSSSSQAGNAPTQAEQAAERARLARIADKAARELADKATAHARKAPPARTAHPSVNDAPHLAGLAPHVILDAKKATGKESLYLSAIGRRLRERSSAGAGAAADGHAEAQGPRGGPDDGRKPAAGGSQQQQQQQQQLRPAAPAGAGAGAGRDARKAKKEPPEDRDWDERVAAAWPVFWKYFNGLSALERIPLQEEMKRKEAYNLLTAMSEHLICVRHW